MKFQCVCALSLLVWLSLASSCSCTGYGGYRHSDLGSYKNGYTIWGDFITRMMKLKGCTYECDHGHNRNCDYDQYILAEEYVAAFCHSNSKKFSCKKHVDMDHWIIHGLWPNKGGTKGPVCCKRDKNGTIKVQDLIPRLKKEWTNLNNRKNFWDYEWKKHGTCSHELNSPEKYFRKGLDLYENGFNYGDILKNANITPSQNNEYSVQDILDAFVEGAIKLGAINEIKCFKNGKEFHLMEIRVCLSKDDFKPIQCKGGKGVKSSTCGNGKHRIKYYKY